DGIWRRAPNATPGFLRGKVQCRLNNTLVWLDNMPDEKKITTVRFAISQGYQARTSAAIEEKATNLEVQARRKFMAQKRDKRRRNQRSRKIFKSLEGAVVDETLSDQVVVMIDKIKNNVRSLCGLLFTHIWEEDDGGDMLY
ncbi:hypothetical protein EGW08_023658, partial [Elysia chlorotica]